MRLFSRSVAMLGMPVLLAIAMPSSGEDGGDIPEDKKRVISKMTCKELEALLRNVETRIARDKRKEENAKDALEFAEIELWPLEKYEKELRAKIKAETDKAKQKGQKSELREVTRDIRTQKRRIRTLERNYVRAGKKTNSVWKEEDRIKQELIDRKC